MEPVVETVVALVDVVAVLGSFPALAGASLTVERGEIVLLRGPNGAGKTSLLRMCAGLLPVERGEATVLGCDLVADRTAVRNRVGLLGHSNGLYADLSVADNVRFWGATVGATVEEIRKGASRQRVIAVTSVHHATDEWVGNHLIVGVGARDSGSGAAQPGEEGSNQ